jgi:VanZ family protein
VLKKLSLFAAVSWTLIVFSLCLVKSSEIPAVNIVNLDKVIHAFFHFVFVILWFMWLSYHYKQTAYYRLLGVVFVLSILYGVAIEIAQLVFTETRFADVFDVLANLTGAVLGAIVIVLWAKFFCTSKI